MGEEFRNSCQPCKEFFPAAELVPLRLRLYLLIDKRANSPDAREAGLVTGSYQFIRAAHLIPTDVSHLGRDYEV